MIDNMLICGDNLETMKKLYEEHGSFIDLIYIDPPFCSNRNYGIDKKGFEDKWDGGLETYIPWISERLQWMHKLLKNTGSIFIHLDWHAMHYVKIEMDRVFGYNNFRNDIVWLFGGKGLKNVKSNLVRNYNTITFYSKAERDVKLFLKSGVISESVLKRFGKYMNSEYKIPFKALKDSNDKVELERAVASFRKTHGRDPNPEDIVRDYSEGMLLKDTWDDIPIVRESHTYAEYTGYPTQKPEALLERIIKLTTTTDDVVADFFSGSGTTISVAQKLGRRWIGVDQNPQAIEIATKRLDQITKEK